jgi:hypothetical protein
LQIADPDGERRHTDNEQRDHNDVHCLLLCGLPNLPETAVRYSRSISRAMQAFSRKSYRLE